MNIIKCLVFFSYDAVALVDEMTLFHVKKRTFLNLSTKRFFYLLVRRAT